jgi:hypothetical protein
VTKVFIENMPEQAHWLVSWAPIIIALLLSLIISILTLRWAIKQFRATSRPYVWAMDPAGSNSERKQVYFSNKVSFLVSNSPAKINSMKHDYHYFVNGKKEILYELEEKDQVLFPHGNSQFIRTFEEFDAKRKKIPNGITLFRSVKINYSDLSGSVCYEYLSKSKFSEEKNQWELESESSS